MYQIRSTRYKELDTQLQCHVKNQCDIPHVGYAKNVDFVYIQYPLGSCSCKKSGICPTPDRKCASSMTSKSANLLLVLADSYLCSLAITTVLNTSLKCLCLPFPGPQQCYNKFHPTETYITHFLQLGRFPKAPVLARRKVNFYFTPREVS